MLAVDDVIVHGDAKRASDVDDFFIIRMSACDCVGMTHGEPVLSYRIFSK
jgi:hypothetical protein